MYGESILAEELNHLADQALQNFIKENNIRILGRPMLADNQEMLDIKPSEDKAYTLNFEIGYEPSYTIALDGQFSKYEIKMTKEMVEKEIEAVKKHFTKLEDSADPIAEGDTSTSIMIMGIRSKESLSALRMNYLKLAPNH